MSHRYRFGDLLLDPQSFRLLQDGKPLSIEPKSLNVLIFLVQNQGRLIERKELLSAVWGDAFVTDHVLNRSIGQLRKVLGDDSKEPRYIETVPTLGYRFIAEVEIETLDASVAAAETGSHPAGVEAAPLQPPVVQTKRRVWLGRTLRVSGIVLAAALAVFATMQIRHRREHADDPIRSLAVLPLEDLSPGAREDYFADGMTDELITELAHIPGLRVVSRTSVMQDKGARKSLAQIARELDVDAIVEGSVVRSGDRVRITAQLIDTRSDKHLWAHSFEGPAGDVLSLQDSVAREISAQTSTVLKPAVGGKLNAGHIDPAAHDDYLRGLYFVQRRDSVLAATYFRKSIAREPGYADANAGLAEALVTQMFVDGEHVDELMSQAIAAAKRALVLDPESGEAFTALGAIDTSYLMDWNAAEENLRKGIELSPSSSDAETWFAVYLVSVGRAPEAVTAMRRAVSLSPFSFWANRLLASTLFYARRYDEALEALQRAIEIAPDKDAFIEQWKSGAYEMQGRYEDAVEADLKDFESDTAPKEVASLRSAFQTGGWKGYQEARVSNLLPRSIGQCYMNPIGMSYARLGNFTEAFRFYNRDVDNHCTTTVWDLAADPRLDKMRQDPRFGALLHRVNLPH